MADLKRLRPGRPIRLATVKADVPPSVEISISKRKNTCETCGKAFATRSDLRKHIRVHTGEKPFVCKVCGQAFAQIGTFKGHLSRHTGVKPFSCKECGKAFAVKQRLVVHIRTHTGEKPYICSTCKKSFARGGQLLQHERIHTGLKPYGCPEPACQRRFSCSTNLKMHIRRHSGEKSYMCPIPGCNKAFSRSDGLRKHISGVHGGVKPFHCTICKKSFKGHFLQHLRTHSEEKPFGCDTCGHTFAQRSQLKVHQRTHTGERPYVCKICRTAFSHSTALKLHTRLHTGEKPFHCQLCPSTFLQLPHLKKHMRCVHKRDKPYLCLPCDEYFYTKNELLAHEADHRVASPVEIEEGKEEGKGKKEEKGACCLALPNGKIIPLKRINPIMSTERLRMLLAILLKRISTPARLQQLGYGSKLIDLVLEESIETSGRVPVGPEDGFKPEEALRKNVEILLEWTIPSEYLENFKQENKSVEDILEELAS